MKSVQKMILTLVVCLALAAASCDKSTPPAPEQATPTETKAAAPAEKPATETSAPAPAAAVGTELFKLALDQDESTQTAGDFKFAVKNAKFIPEGKVGGAYQFDATQQAYLVSETKAVSGLDNFSITFWVKLLAPNKINQVVYAEASSTSFSPLLEVVTGSTSDTANFTFFIRDDANNVALNLVGNQAVPLGQWVHVAVTSDAGKAKLYVNGVLDVTDSYKPVKLGNDRTSLGAVVRPDVVNYFNGVIDEVKVFNGVLGEDAVKDMAAH